jgi:hypothetical protein
VQKEFSGMSGNDDAFSEKSTRFWNANRREKNKFYYGISIYCNFKSRIYVSENSVIALVQRKTEQSEGEREK